jgi:hypothetical protein
MGNTTFVMMFYALFYKDKKKPPIPGGPIFF